MTMRHRAIFLSAALLAAGFAAMAAGTRSPPPQQSSAGAPAVAQHQMAPRETTGRASAESFDHPAPRLLLHGIVACAPAASPALACNKLEPLLAQ